MGTCTFTKRPKNNRIMVDLCHQTWTRQNGQLLQSVTHSTRILTSHWDWLQWYIHTNSVTWDTLGPFSPYCCIWMVLWVRQCNCSIPAWQPRWNHIHVPTREIQQQHRLCSKIAMQYLWTETGHVHLEQTHASKLITVGYDQLTSNMAIYLCNHNDDITILMIYIDNVMSFGNTKPGLSKSQAELHKLFEMKKEDPNWVMGFKLVENHKEATTSIDHSLYINAVLCWFIMDDCNTVHTPLDSRIILSVHDCPQTDERSEMCTIPYQELVGALTWIAVVSWPDISFVATYLMRFNMNPR